MFLTKKKNSNSAYLKPFQSGADIISKTCTYFEDQIDMTFFGVDNLDDAEFRFHYDTILVTHEDREFFRKRATPEAYFHLFDEELETREEEYSHWLSLPDEHDEQYQARRKGLIEKYETEKKAMVSLCEQKLKNRKQNMPKQNKG
jgi:hypothetical protein